MDREIRFACPLDCYDNCRMIATVSGGRVRRVAGDPDHPFTAGFVCAKGRALLERSRHPQRLTSPLRRTAAGWVEIGWREALDEMAENLDRVRRQDGSAGILSLSQSGYGGLLKSVDTIFFHHIGGVSVPRGDLCWGAGNAAQDCDFGTSRAHDPADLRHARAIILWGRNPAATGPHLVPLLRRLRRDGVRIVLVDPRTSASARLADTHLAPRPATDGALALSMAAEILRAGLHDRKYLDRHVKGFRRFREHVRECSLSWGAQRTGLAPAQIADLARLYATARPAAILLGIGLQRYGNGANTIRCIDSLGALTGNIGVPGAGVGFANRLWSPWFGEMAAASLDRARNQRTYSLPRMADFITNADPPVRCMVISKANPLSQLPDTGRAQTAFARVGFKVVIDHFMTDTAQAADLVLPATTVLEEEDLFFNNMLAPYLYYSARAEAPPDGVRGEYEIFRSLARRLGLPGYPDMERDRFMEAALEPLTRRFGLTMEQLRAGRLFRLPGSDVPWRDGDFDTPSGRFELYSERALAACGHALPTWLPPAGPPAGYPLRLLTPHASRSMHSQHFAFDRRLPLVRVGTRTARGQGLADGGRAVLASPRGRLEVRVRIDERLGGDVIWAHQGWWRRSGEVNRLTEATVSDMGEQAAYYDCFCRIETV